MRDRPGRKPSPSRVARAEAPRVRAKPGESTAPGREGRPASRPGRRAILLRLTAAEEAFLTEAAGSSRERARYLRRLLERDMERHRRRARAAMFATAAGDADAEEKAQRRALVRGFSNRD